MFGVNRNGVAGQGPAIPEQAFRPAKCPCGSEEFYMVHHALVYAGGLYSKNPVVNVSVPVMRCCDCHQNLNLEPKNQSDGKTSS